MGFLIKKEDRDLREFYKNMILYLNFYGLGSVKDLLNMKIYELHELKSCLDDNEVKERWYNLHGLSTK